MRAAAPPPAEALAELRRHREEVAALLALRAHAAIPPRVAGEAAAAPAAPDPDLALERAETALAQAAEARGDFGWPPLPEADHRARLAGYLAAGLRRPPAWSDPASLPPSPGAWCSCCGRFDQSGGRWWREGEAPRGWRCATCHTPPPALAVEEATA